MQKGSGYSILMVRVHLAHHNCITSMIKLLSKKPQFYHDDYNCFTIIQPFSLEKSRTLKIYPHIYPLWGIAFALVFDYSYS